MTAEESRPLIDYLVQARDAAAVRLPPPVAPGRHRAVGQSLHHAHGAGRLRGGRDPPSRAHHGQGHALGLLPAMKRSHFLKGARRAGAGRARALRSCARKAAIPTSRSAWSSLLPPGGTTDLLARAVGQHFAQAWGQPVVADNRAGANGVVAGEIVAKAPGDGYTLSMVAMGHAINPLIYKKLPYDGDNGLHADQPDRDLPAARAGASRAQGQHAGRAFGAGEKRDAAADLRARAATAPRSIWPARCSRTWPASP